MAFERRQRLSTESDQSSTSTSYSTGSTRNPRSLSPSLSFGSTSTNQRTHSNKRGSNLGSPAELLLARTKNTFLDLNPYFQCSSLPSHWRKNKSLRFLVRTKNHLAIQANTRVVILAGNDHSPCAPLKNNVSWFRDGQAEFTDLRFLGTSGRGKKFTLTIIIETTPPQQCTYRRAIKITVDGPRKKREQKIKSDVNDIHGEQSNSDGESDTETPIIDTKPNLSQGSSGLLLLAAAAEQKRKDEEDELHRHPVVSIPAKVNYSMGCLSPPPSLSSHFSHAVAFSPTSILSSDDYSAHLSSSSPTTNLIFSLTSTSDRFDFSPHPRPRHEPQTRLETSTNSSSSTATASAAHVLCR